MVSALLQSMSGTNDKYANYTTRTPYATALGPGSTFSSLTGDSGVAATIQPGSGGSLTITTNSLVGTVGTAETITGPSGSSLTIAPGAGGTLVEVFNSLTGKASSAATIAPGTAGTLTLTVNNINGPDALTGNIAPGNLGGTLNASFTQLSSQSVTNLGIDGSNVVIGAGSGTIVGGAGLVVRGGSAASDSLVLRSTSNVTKGQVHLDETTDSTSATTGCCRIDGGVGVAKQLVCDYLAPSNATFTTDNFLVLADTWTQITFTASDGFGTKITRSANTTWTNTELGTYVISGNIQVSIDAGRTQLFTSISESSAPNTGILTYETNPANTTVGYPSISMSAIVRIPSSKTYAFWVYSGGVNATILMANMGVFKLAF